MRSTALVAAAVSAALALTACPRAEPVPAPTAAPSVVPIHGGTIVLAISQDLDALDPHLAASPASWAVARALHRGLYAYPDVPGTPGRTPVPDLAIGLPVAERGATSALVRLKPGVRDADGSPVTAADAVASLYRLAGSDRGIGPALRAAMADAVETDELVLRLTARRSLDRLIDLLAHPQAAVLDAGVRAIGRVRAPAGAGPYELVREDRSGYTLRRRADLPADPVRPSYADQLRVLIGGRPRSDGVMLDPGPPDLARPGTTPRGRTAEVATGCVRYLDLRDARLPASARTVVERAVRARLPEIGTGPVATTAVPPLLSSSPPPARPGRAGAAAATRFDLVVSSSPRDQAEVRALRRALPRVRVRTVVPATLYGGGAVPRGARVRTWCGDWPHASAVRSSPAAASTSVPLWWPVERVSLGASIRGFTGSPMFPRGDPTALWLAGD